MSSDWFRDNYSYMWSNKDKDREYGGMLLMLMDEVIIDKEKNS